jgi:glycosyltransferase involved in cell wall biosynthesis
VTAARPPTGPVRVLELGKYYFPYMGGIEHHLYVLSNELKDRVELEVVVANTARRTIRENVEGVRVTRCGSFAHVASTSLSASMVFELSRRPYDVLHLHLPNPMGAASYLASKKPRNHRLIVTYHSDVVRQRLLAKVYAPVVDRVLARAAAVIATSPNYLESSDVLQRYREKSVVIPYGIDLDLYRPTPEREAEARAIRARLGGGPLLLCVGRLIYYKGFEYAIRALVNLPRAHLVIIGDGPLREELQQLARDCNVADRVTLAGDVHNNRIAPYYLASDVYLLPSIARSEAFGIVQIEALAAGIPIINTSLPSGVPFVSRDGETGFTVPPEDPLALAAAAGRLLDDPSLRARFGAAGRARAGREFSKEALTQRLLAVYEGRAPTAPAR